MYSDDVCSVHQSVRCQPA